MISVIIIEDNLDMLHVLENIVKNVANILYLGNGMNADTAIKIIQEKQPRVVLMDIYLGDKSGIDCVRVLKPKCANTEFIMCTSFSEDRLVYNALLAGASSYMMKNNTPDMIINTIMEVSEGRSLMSSDIARKVIRQIQKENIDSRIDYKITPKEALVLEQLAKGKTYQEVSDELNISAKTLKTHIYRIYNKLQVNNRVEAINKFYNNGFK